VANGDLRQRAPSVLFRDDGKALFYAGSLNGIHGDSGTGKGWVAMAAIAAELAEGPSCVLIDLEDTADTPVSRLHTVGVSDALILEFLICLRPTEPFDQRAVDRLLCLCDEHTRGGTPVGLIVLDSLGEAFALEGVDENEDAEVGPWLRRVTRPLADTATALLVVDHSTKAADNPPHPSRSKRKRAAITGASHH
jgi:RecA/RadA recombinase